MSDADRAKAAEVTERKPLTALEWLRVTHADTLSGRRIEEAVAAARADADARWTAAVEGLAEELGRPRKGPQSDLAAAYTRGQQVAAALLRGLVTGSSEEGKA